MSAPRQRRRDVSPAVMNALGDLFVTSKVSPPHPNQEQVMSEHERRLHESRMAAIAAMDSLEGIRQSEGNYSARAGLARRAEASGTMGLDNSWDEVLTGIYKTHAQYSRPAWQPTIEKSPSIFDTSVAPAVAPPADTTIASEFNESAVSAERQELERVHEELREVNLMLKKKQEKLSGFEAELREKEALLSSNLEMLKDHVRQEVAGAAGEGERRVKKAHAGVMSHLEDVVEKMRGQVKMFGAWKDENTRLKAELVRVKEDNSRLKRAKVTAENRVTILQRQVSDMDNSKSKTTDATVSFTDWKNGGGTPAKKAGNQSSSSAAPASSAGVDVLCLLLQAFLKHKGFLSYANTAQFMQSAPRFVCGLLGVLPLVARTKSNEEQAAFLSFLWHTVRAADAGADGGAGRERIKTALLRVEDELYGARSGRSRRFVRSDSLEVRILSAMIVLRHSQHADRITTVLDIMRADVGENEGKELFVRNRGVVSLVSVLGSTNKSVLSHAGSLLLSLVVSGDSLGAVLQQFATEEFFRAAASALRCGGVDFREAMCVVLQKLSRVSTTRRLFEINDLVGVLLELQTHGSDDKDFMQMNLKSIFGNLKIKK